ncbi:MAG: primase-helicase family protein [Roseibium sp.]|uniref:primase-helicase family protein n=1 Tax=Roseibium sp. TaxID=1936156 RepID=UPI003296DA82
MSDKPNEGDTPPSVHDRLKAELSARKTGAVGDQGQRGKASKANDPKAKVLAIIDAATQAPEVDHSEDGCAEHTGGYERDDASVDDLGGTGPLPQDWGYSLETLNSEWSLVLIGSKAVMVREQPWAKIEDRVRVVQIDAFRHLLSNTRTQYMGSDGKIKTITWAKRWEGERWRRQYDGIEFHPDPQKGEGTKGYLNLWRGFSYQPDPQAGSWAIFRDHMLTNICSGDEALFKWVFGWFAHMFQRPRERPGTAIVVRGLMGTGKSIMGEVMGDLIAAHYFQVDDPRYITGQFNAHMSACLLLQAEEAVWAGDKVAEGRLKGLITSKTQMIESKGVDPYRLDNYVRVLMTSNEDWVVPAGKDERRYCVLDVADTVKENHSYFREMFEELDNGGRAALLDALLTFDLSQVNLRQIPRTGALLQQKLRSLDSVDAYVYERLCEGTLLRADATWSPDAFVVRQMLYDEYLTWADKVGIKRRADLNQFGRSIKKLIPHLQDTRPRDGGTRKRAYVFPPLPDCRASFEAAVGQGVDWPLDDPGWAQRDEANSSHGETGW